MYAQLLVRRQAQLRKSGELPWLQPDAKSQVSFRYENGRPVAIETVVLSTQHVAGIKLDELRSAVSRHILEPVVPMQLRAANYREFINPTGRFVTGGPKGDTGVTGRKIIVDTYGGAAPHGGGAFSGKDPSKVDRSGAYMARYLARAAVARGWAARCLIQLSYAIGVAEPVGFLVETFGTGVVADEQIADTLRGEFDFTPAGIIDQLSLRRTKCFETAAYGHFGRSDVAFPWEATS
jgi:S-adenosylmethionine synthetase